jgi:small subunit ribosomal protein S1
LEDGVDGLLHISKLGQGQRIRHPQDVLNVGQELKVVIEKIDQEEKRISLALGGQTDDVKETSYNDQPAASGLGTLGELLKASQQKKERKKRR